MLTKIKETPAVTAAVRNWFPLTIMTIFILSFLNKDLSFSLNLGAPQHQSTPEMLDKKQRLTKPKKREMMTDKGNIPEKKSMLHMLGFGLSKDDNNVSSVEKMKALEAVSIEAKIAYIRRFAHVAENEQTKFGIPASIILANSLYQSVAGTSYRSSKTNNHFDLACGDYWQGEQSKENGRCYRVYETAWASFRDHSTSITSGKFDKLKMLGAKDFKSWAKGLQELGYGNDQLLEKHLLNIINHYNLFEFDD